MWQHMFPDFISKLVSVRVQIWTYGLELVAGDYDKNTLLGSKFWLSKLTMQYFQYQNLLDL